MHWGHATSVDLVTWRHLPIALFPDPLGTVFSGSVVVDRGDTSGLGRGRGGPLVAIFTHFRWGLQRQSVASSVDGGLTWKKYPGNPVIKNPLSIHFRDPKVFYHEKTRSWILALTAGKWIRFYRSPDLLKWTLSGQFGRHDGSHAGVWECPDLFELPVDGDEKKKKWVMLVSVQKRAPAGGSGTQYFVGEFDGETFVNADTPDTVRWLDWGADNYAGITYNNVPEADGRRIFVGWMSNWDYAQKTPDRPLARRDDHTEGPHAHRSGRQDRRSLPSPWRSSRECGRGGLFLTDQTIDGDRIIRGDELTGGSYEIAAEWEAGPDAQFEISLENDRGDAAAGRL